MYSDIGCFGHAGGFPAACQLLPNYLPARRGWAWKEFPNVEVRDHDLLMLHETFLDGFEYDYHFQDSNIR